MTLTVNVAANASGSVTNTATVSGGGETNTANDTASDTVTIAPPADLTVSMTDSGNFKQGDAADTYYDHRDQLRRGADGGHGEPGRYAARRTDGHGLQRRRLEREPHHADGHPQRPRWPPAAAMRP